MAAYRGIAENTTKLQNWLSNCPAVKEWREIDSRILEFVYDDAVEVADVPAGVHFNPESLEYL